jgi:triphosphoribosyl-dephospho-CoA synthase
VLARKPGNVHPYRDFPDTTLTDFLVSAAASCPVLDEAGRIGVGQAVLEGIRRRRQVVSCNTNLGILLLLAPLAAVPRGVPLRQGLKEVLDRLSVADAEAAFEAIRLAQPGGLGQVEREDVRKAPSLPLREVMSLAAHRDLIAKQYVTTFLDVFEIGVPRFLEGVARGWPLEEAILFSFLHLLATHPDSLIARKRGLAEAQLACEKAREVLTLGWPDRDAAQQALGHFDRWLREDGHRRNPGTTADLVTASLYVVLREGRMQYPPAAGFASARVRLW